MPSSDEPKSYTVVLEEIIQSKLIESIFSKINFYVKNGLWFHRISWFKDGQPYPWKNFGSSLPILFARNQSLVIVSMSPQDEGHYKCVATDGSDVSASCLLRLLICQFKTFSI